MTHNGAEGEIRRAMAGALEVEGMSLEEVNRASANLKSVLGARAVSSQRSLDHTIRQRSSYIVDCAANAPALKIQIPSTYEFMDRCRFFWILGEYLC